MTAGGGHRTIDGVRRSLKLLATSSVLLVGLTAVAEPIPVARVADAEPAPGPDGRVVFVSNRLGGMHLFVTDAEGGAPVRLTSAGGPYDTPAWSPDGRSIAAVDESAGNPDIVIIDLPTRSVRRLIESPQRDLHPAWSPDGLRLLFTRYTDGGAGGGEGTLSLHEVTLADGRERALGAGSYASWSPDGRSRAYWRYFDRNAEIAIATESGGELRLTDDAAFDGWPSWSPDGARVVFARERGDDADLWIADVGKRTVSPLISGPGRLVSPKFSRDGKSIYFQWTNQGRTGIWRIPAPHSE